MPFCLESHQWRFGAEGAHCIAPWRGYHRPWDGHGHGHGHGQSDILYTHVLDVTMFLDTLFSFLFFCSCKYIGVCNYCIEGRQRLRPFPFTQAIHAFHPEACQIFSFSCFSTVYSFQKPIAWSPCVVLQIFYLSASISGRMIYTHCKQLFHVFLRGVYLVAGGNLILLCCNQWREQAI